jgi:predicted nucleic acid-binding protein
MAVYLLDTTVIIDVLNNKRGRSALILELAEAGHTLACCPINVTEVYAGLRPKEERAAENLLSSLLYFSIPPQAARLAGDLRRSYARKGVTLNLGDVLIAAVAIYNDLTLMTDNVKHFPMENLSLFPLPRA